MIFETHAHYDDERFTEDQESVLADLPRKGISPVINVGASIASTRTTLELAQKYDFIYAAVGVHPSDIDGLNEETFAWLTQQTTYEKDWIITGIKKRMCRNGSGIGLPARWNLRIRQICRSSSIRGMRQKIQWKLCKKNTMPELQSRA